MALVGIAFVFQPRTSSILRLVLDRWPVNYTFQVLEQHNTRPHLRFVIRVKSSYSAASTHFSATSCWPPWEKAWPTVTTCTSPPTYCRLRTSPSVGFPRRSTAAPPTQRWLNRRTNIFYRYQAVPSDVFRTLFQAHTSRVSAGLLQLVAIESIGLWYQLFTIFALQILT